MTDETDAADRNKTGWILGFMSAGMSVPILIWALRGPDVLTERLGLHAGVWGIPWAWVLALAVAAGYIAYTFYGVPAARRMCFELSPLKLLAIWAAVVSGILEEVLFRQLLMDWLAGVDVAVVWQVVISAVLFGLAHASWVLLRGEFAIALPVVASTTVLGGLLALVYIVGGREILPCIVAHMVVNFAIEPGLIYSAVSGKWNEGQESASHAQTPAAEEG